MAQERGGPVIRRKRRPEEGGGKLLRVIGVDGSISVDPDAVVEDGLLRSIRMGLSVTAPPKPTQIYRWRRANAPPIYVSNGYTLWREPTDELTSSPLINYVSEQAYIAELNEDNTDHRRARRRQQMLETCYFVLCGLTAFTGLFALPMIFGWRWAGG